MNWRYYYDETVHYTIKNQLVKGYYKLEDYIAKGLNVKATLDERVKFESSTQSQSGYYKNSNNIDDLYNDYVSNALTDYSSNMDIEGYVISSAKGSYLGEGNLEIDVDDGDSVVKGLNYFINTTVDSPVGTPVHKKTYVEVGNEIGIDYISNRIQSFKSEMSTESISKFATHLEIFMDSKKETSQRTDFHDDLLEIYSSSLQKFSISSYDAILNVEYSHEMSDFLDYMNESATGVTNSDKNTLMSFFNMEHIRGYMSWVPQNKCFCNLYIDGVQAKLNQYSEYRDIVEGLGSKMDLQIAAHETEYEVNSEIKNVIDAINLDDGNSLVEHLSKLNEVYLINDTNITFDQREILGITEEEYNTPNSGEFDELYNTILNQYIEGELTDAEILNLFVEYPYLNRYIDQYYIENFSTIKDDEYGNKLTELYVLNCAATNLIEDGVDEIMNVKVSGEKRIEFDVKYDAVETAYMENIEENKVLTYGDFLLGAEGSSEVFRSGLEDQLNENNERINELEAKYENVAIFATTVTFEKLLSLGVGKGKEITADMIEATFGSIPGAGILVDVTLAEIQEYYDTQVEIESIKNDNTEIQNTINLGDELKDIKLLPTCYYSISGESGSDSTKFVATAQTYELVNVIYTLDKIMDSNTSQEEKYDLQMYLIQLANPDVDIYNLDDDDRIDYGDLNNDSQIDINDFQGDGISFEISDTYNNANVNGALDHFINNSYYNDDGTIDMDRIVANYHKYEDMIVGLDEDITSYFADS